MDEAVLGDSKSWGWARFLLGLAEARGMQFVLQFSGGPNSPAGKSFQSPLQLGSPFL